MVNNGGHLISISKYNMYYVVLCWLRQVHLSQYRPVAAKTNGFVMNLFL